MTHAEALKKALEKLGGRAPLPKIYPLAIPYITFKEGSDIEATLRTAMKRNPKIFRHSPGKPNGWWELLSFQEEIASRDKRIKELEEEVARLKAIKTEDAFVIKIVDVVKKRFRHKSERNKAVAVSQLMAFVGREDASENLAEWLDGKEKPFFAIGGDYVLNKHVENEIDNVEAGATGVSINKSEK